MKSGVVSPEPQADTPIQRCPVHKARNITDRIDPELHAAVRRALGQAWEIDDTDKAERLLRNLARRLEFEAAGGSKGILEGLDEILTVTRQGLPLAPRRALASTIIIEATNTKSRVSPFQHGWRQCGGWCQSTSRRPRTGARPE